MFSCHFAVVVCTANITYAFYYFKAMLMIRPTAGFCYFMCNEKNRYYHVESLITANN